LSLPGRVTSLSRLVPPPGAGVTRRWRFRRDVVIFVAYANGIPQRELADVFDLPQSRISAIVRQIMTQLDEERDEGAQARPSRP
jgi:hypothetical protein